MFLWSHCFRLMSSTFAHRKLRQLIKTQLLMTEHVRTLEPHVDFALAEATDFLRGDVGYDGITGAMKLAHAAEGLGLDIEFHGPGPAERQCMAAIRLTRTAQAVPSQIRLQPSTATYIRLSTYAVLAHRPSFADMLCFDHLQNRSWLHARPTPNRVR
jgi:L-alanine-DL-glutamate epimerase-like enolase superfamily enzyme